MSWTNFDGLVVEYGKERADKVNEGTTSATPKRLVMKLTGTDIPSSVATPLHDQPYIPAGAYITRASLIITDAFTSGGAATLTIGTYESDGTAIDADGIDATIALTAIDADGDVVACDGAQVGGVVTVGTKDAFVEAIYGTAAFTAGEAELVIEYVER